MSDLEQRLADALSDGARGAPPAVGLAGAARSRARARRRNRLVGAAAAVALAVGLPAAVLATHGSDPEPQNPSQVANDPDAAGPDARGGYHYESWHHVTIEVPDTWGYGTLNQWCVDDGMEGAPRVDRPGGVQTLVLCTPGSGYGVSFAPKQQGGEVDWPVAEQHSDAWPDGAFVGAVTVGGVVVTVAAPEVNVALEVLGSVRAIGPQGDPNGCTSSRGEAPPMAVSDGAMRICRYDAQGLLEQSEVLAGEDTERAVAALEAAPEAADSCMRNVTDVEPIVRLDTSSISVNVDLGGECPTVHGHGVGQDRTITPDVLYWALSPGWSGSVPGDVSLPSELRRR